MVTDVSDNHLNKERIKGAEENMRGKVAKVVVDGGFYETDAVRGLMREGQEVMVLPELVNLTNSYWSLKFF